MEDFSQSRGDDDLFDDEIVPIEQTPAAENITTQLEQVSLDPIPVTTPPELAQTPSYSSANRGRGRGRGRGGISRGGGTPKRGGLLDSKYASPSRPQAEKGSLSQSLNPPTTDQSLNPVENTQTSISETKADGETEARNSTPSTAQISPSTTTTPQKPSAVRGDRTATGGVKKPKLTEEELTAKLTAAKERSQTLAAAHARAQEDAAKFEERERIAQEKRKRDNVNRRAMDQERERNRLRKMKAAEGREWDAEKKEEDFAQGRGGRGGRRSMGPLNNGKDDDDLRMYEWNENRGGRGRGRGRGRGSGRGARGASSANGSDQQQPDLNAESEFPALPGGSKEASSTSKKDSFFDNGATGSWAEQMESSEITSPTPK